MKFYNPFKPHLIKVGEKYAVRKFVPLSVYLNISDPRSFNCVSDITKSTWSISNTLEEAQEHWKNIKCFVLNLKPVEK
jgi:hypothetical protein